MTSPTPKRKVVDWVTLILLALVIVVTTLAALGFYLFKMIDETTRMAYYKQWTFRFLCEYHEKNKSWPKSWADISASIDTKSPFPFEEIKKRVIVKWENLGVVIDPKTDYYIRTEPNSRWQGDDFERDMIDYIEGKKTEKGPAPLRNWPSP